MESPVHDLLVETRRPVCCTAARPCDVAGKTLLDSYAGHEIEQRARSRRVAQVPANVTRATFPMLDGQLAANQLLHQVRDSQDAHFLAAADVDDVAQESITFPGKDHAPGGGLHPGDVTSLQPLPQDHERLPRPLPPPQSSNPLPPRP